MKWLAALAVALGMLALPATAAAQAGDIVVSTGVDGDDGSCLDGDCTLREAIFVARPIDRVIVPARAYTLTDGPIALAGDVIVGAGARSTVVDQGNGAIFTVGAGANQVSGITLTGGDGLHELQGARVGGAIRVSGAFAPASLTLTDSVVRANTASVGGGIAVQTGGTLDLVRSTVSGNTTGGSHGGGIYIDAGSATLTSSTVSGNTAVGAAAAANGGGIYAAGGTLTLQNVTLAGNRAAVDGGLYRQAGTVTLNSTIVSSPADRTSCGGSIAIGGINSLSDDSSCGALRVADPQLGGLADNGGPTDTHALAAGSAAIDGGDVGCPPTDQRGVARVGTCDVGAFEYVPPLPPPPPPPSDDLPPPEAGENVNAVPRRGTVRVKLPGRKRFRVLAKGEQIPVGTTIDTLRGRVTITAAGDQTATFYDGIFRLRQTDGVRPLTTLVLTERLRCPKRGSASTAARRKKKRRLWGNGNGRFRTDGQYSSATVRGTKWLVEDRCASTLTRVVTGRVAVRDFTEDKTVIVRARKRYIARRG